MATSAWASCGACIRFVNTSSCSEWQKNGSTSPSNRSCSASRNCPIPTAAHTTCDKLECTRCTKLRSMRSNKARSEHRKQRSLDTSTPPSFGMSSATPATARAAMSVMEVSVSTTLTTAASSFKFRGCPSHSAPSSWRKLTKSSPLGDSRAPSALRSASCAPNCRGSSNINGDRSTANRQKTRDGLTSTSPTGTHAKAASVRLSDDVMSPHRDHRKSYVF
mmetsp:Transcript_59282/g.86960  ORF Transcript_59282/g.86960 Transcript_59282/m.86960 type:complete len:220 (+) Transcript_59282:584-1243(+)